MIDVYDFMLAQMRVKFRAVLEEVWVEKLKKFPDSEKVTGIRYLVEKKLIPDLLEKNEHGIEFAIIAPKISRIVMEEFLKTKAK